MKKQIEERINILKSCCIEMDDPIFDDIDESELIDELTDILWKCRNYYEKNKDKTTGDS